MVSIIGRKIPTTNIDGAQAGGLGDVFGRFAQILSDPLSPAIKREKLMEMNRQNIGTEDLATQAESGDLDPLRSAGASVRAGYAPADLARLNVFSTANRYGPTDQRTTNALTGAGQYTQSPAHAQQELANRLAVQQAQEATKLRIHGQTPTTVLENGVETLRPLDQAWGGRPVMDLSKTQGAYAARAQGQPGGISALSPAEQSFISAQPTQATPYTYGKPGGGTGAGVLQGTELKPITINGQEVSTVGRLEGASGEAFGAGDSLEKTLFDVRLFTGQASTAIDQLIKDLAAPDAGASVGVLGQGAVLATNILAQARAAGELVGLDAPEVKNGIDNVMRTLPPGVFERAQSLGIDATKLRSQITNLGYLVAKAQNPKGVITGPDFVHASATIGANLQNPAAMAAVLTQVKGSLDANLNAHEDLFERTRGRPAPGRAPVTPSFTPAAPASQAPPSVVRKYNPATGLIE